MMKLSSLLKKKLHPFLGYAFLFGLSAVALSSTARLVGPELDNFTPPSAAVAPQPPTITPPKPETWPQDLESLKASARQFAAQLAVIKSQVAELEKYGRQPPQALMDAIGEGEQLTAVISRANTLEQIGNFDAAAKLQAIGSEISANSRF
jgi:hypothetical protein